MCVEVKMGIYCYRMMLACRFGWLADSYVLSCGWCFLVRSKVWVCGWFVCNVTFSLELSVCLVFASTSGKKNASYLLVIHLVLRLFW